MDKFKIVFLSGKLGDVDGVSLEVDKWIESLLRLGHDVYTIAGSYADPVVNVPGSQQYTLPAIRFGSDLQREVEPKIFPHIRDTIATPQSIKTLTKIEDRLWEEGARAAIEIRDIVRDNDIDLIVGENSNSMPMSLVAGIASYILAEDNSMATLYHHHDFWWERSRYCNCRLEAMLNKIMPPLDPGIEHTVISSYTAHILKTLKRLDSTVVPNCEDFSKPPELDEYNKRFRHDFGFKDDDILVVQPTRIVPRKRIEDSIRFLHAFLKKYPEYRDKMKFIISLYGGDEGEEYTESLWKLAEKLGIKIHMIADRVASVRSLNDMGERVYTNRDVLVNCDFAIYLPIWEGFGNALLEAVAAKTMVIISTYMIYKTDIRSAGLQCIEVRDHYNNSEEIEITDRSLDELNRILRDPKRKREMEEQNFKAAAEEFSLQVLGKKLNTIIGDYSDEIRASRRRLKRSWHQFSV